MITVFLPCRAGSQRIPKKNTRSFCGIEGGLLRIKLKQLLDIKMVDQIVLSTNDDEVIDIAKGISDKINIDIRPEYLASSSTSTDDLIKYVPTIINEGHVLWTHVTSPFLTEAHYQQAIKDYQLLLKEGIYDSLMSVNKVKSFLWDSKGSINYDRSLEKWPRTQTIQDVYEINSGIFLNSIANYLKFGDRIGQSPMFFETAGYASFDIDWPHDFDLAELIFKYLNN